MSLDWIDALGDINYLAVVIAAVSSFVVGAVWYARGVFGSLWMGLVGLDEEAMGNPDPIIYLSTAVGGFVAALVLAVLMDGRHRHRRGSRRTRVRCCAGRCLPCDGALDAQQLRDETFVAHRRGWAT